MTVKLRKLGPDRWYWCASFEGKAAASIVISRKKAANDLRAAVKWVKNKLSDADFHKLTAP